MVYLAAALIGSAIPSGSKEMPEKQNYGVTVYIFTGTIHSDLILPIHTDQWHWDRFLASGHVERKGRYDQFVAFGWGDRDFYLHTPEWSDLTVGTALGAVAGGNRPVMHVNFLRRPVVGESVHRLTIAPEQYDRLVDFVASSFSTNGSDSLQPIQGFAYGQSDLFYEAKGRYHLFYTCNTWTARALKAAELPAPLWTPFPIGITWHME